jgi:membrane protease YdiL (CAAX protease family)
MARLKPALQIIAWLAWLATVFFLVQNLVVWLLAALPFQVSDSDTLILSLTEALAYGLMLVIGVGGPWLIRRTIKLPPIRDLFGKLRHITWQDVGKAFGAIPGYYLILIVAMIVMMVLVPDLADQEQAIGFDQANNAWWQLTLIFLALALVAPIAEELLMRGLLFGRLRAILPFWPTAIIVSLLFAAAHLQLNVAVDTFILSMFMCRDREQTGALYAPILIHVIKNSVAFVILFMV